MEEVTLFTKERIEETLKELNLEPAEQLEWLHERCKEFGLKVHHKAGRDKLIEAIVAYYNKDVASLVEAEDEAIEEEETAEVKELKFKSLDRYPDETDTEYAARKRKEAHKLIRARITCMNPTKKEIDGEYFTVSNDLYTIRRMIPFRGIPTHFEVAFLDMLRERKFQEFREGKKSRIGDAVLREGYLVPEFAIEILPPLTKEELQQLALEQARAARV